MPSKYTKVFVSVSFLWHQCSFQYCFYDINKYNKIYDCEILSTCTKCWCYLNSWFTHVHVVVLTQLQNYNNKPFRPLTFLVVLEQVSMIEKFFLIYVDEIEESRFCFNFLCFVLVFCCFVMFLFYFCTAEGTDKYETGTNVTRTTKKTPLTTFMKGEEWRLFLSFLLKSDKFSDFFDIAG